MPTLTWFALICLTLLIVSACRTAPHRTDALPTWFDLVARRQPVRRWKQRLDPDWRSGRRHRR